jgi:hypothetical protein
MKKSIKILLGLLMLIIIPLLTFELYLNTLPKEKKAKFALNNKEKIQIGMSEREVLSIIGKPDTTFLDRYSFRIDDSVFVHGYYLGFGSADYLWIDFAKNHKVIKSYSSD